PDGGCRDSRCPGAPSSIAGEPRRRGRRGGRAAGIAASPARRRDHQRDQATDHRPGSLPRSPGRPDPGRADLGDRDPRAALRMAAYLLDTSAVLKRYVQETGTAWIQALAAPAAGHALIVARITLAETVAALTRRERGGSIAAQDAATALADFQFD